jgi:hypothetical protein
MAILKLYMMILGGRPAARNTEQHDIFFAIGTSLKELVPEIKAFWPEAKSNLHIDAWREVTSVDGCRVEVIERKHGGANSDRSGQLFFINLGGYKEGLFDEPHFKMLTVQKDKAQAVKHAKDTPFYKELSVPTPGGESHIDDHFGVDVDEVYNVKDILPTGQKELYSLSIMPQEGVAEDKLHLGYFKLSALPG